jgi:hypothetical protein
LRENTWGTTKMAASGRSHALISVAVSRPPVSLRAFGMLGGHR